MTLQFEFGLSQTKFFAASWPGGGASHWLTVYGDARRFKGAFSSLLVYRRWVGFRLGPMRPICKIGLFRQIRLKKAPNFFFLAAIWYRDGSQNHAF